LPSFAELNLLPELLKAVAEQGYTEPTPIQAQAIPLVLEGRDVLGGAQTGTGKTAGFTLPLLQRLARHANTSASPARHPVRALILTPTRELAAQVEESVRIYGKYVGLRSTVVFGGIDMKPQTAALRQGVEFLVATPGRLLDHVQQKAVNLQQVEAFVLDEADRMLDMGFIPDVRRIMSLLPKQRQNLLFSATLTSEIRTLADSFLHNPVLVQVARNNTAAESVTHLVHPVRRERKRELLAYLIQSRDLRQVLVFNSTRIGANRLAYQLNRDGIHTAAIHGDKTQPERLQALDDFKSGKVRVLVATAWRRGLDIEDLPQEVNFGLPGAPETTCTASADRQGGCERRGDFPGLRRGARTARGDRENDTAEHSQEDRSRLRARWPSRAHDDEPVGGSRRRRGTGAAAASRRARPHDPPASVTKAGGEERRSDFQLAV
jgi:ATP-dependent RNA helicase RhlE